VWLLGRLLSTIWTTVFISAGRAWGRLRGARVSFIIFSFDVPSKRKARQVAGRVLESQKLFRPYTRLGW
jgi:hypothetical protein